MFLLHRWERERESEQRETQSSKSDAGGHGFLESDFYLVRSLH